MSELAERYAGVTSDIADAARSAGRNFNEITTIVVTKFHPVELVRELAELGAQHFGESRHQEAEPKIASLGSVVSSSWHFVGQVQSKKAKAIASYTDVLHSLDRPSLVDALEKAELATPLDVFVQINLTDDLARGGVQPSDLDALVDRVATVDNLRLRGLMAVAPLGDDPRRAFSRVRELSSHVVSVVPTATALSMGMSADYREALAEGATHLRIGTAITGNRPTPG